MRWTLANVANALGVSSPALADSLAGLAGVSIDSRTTRPGELFVAIRGPRFDGHDFVSGALERGAAAAVVEGRRAGEYPEGVRGKLLVVPDTLGALQELARSYCGQWRKAKSGRRIAAVTGSALRAVTTAPGKVTSAAGNYPRIGWPHGLWAA